MKKSIADLVVFGIISVFVAGCGGMGPKTVTRDRFNYNTEISNSWKEQTLLNIIKLRYADMPLFIEVASIVSGYTLEGSVDLNTSFGEIGPNQRIGGAGRYTERPTITYVPITGQKFNMSFMTPIPPSLILFLMQSGWAVDLIFPLTVDAVNEMKSEILTGENMRKGDPGFYRIIFLLRKVQKSGAVGMRIIKKDGQKESTVLFYYKKNLKPGIEAALVELNTILGLSPEADEVIVRYGLIAGNDREIAMLTRSMLQIMVGMSQYIEVPAQHVTDGLTAPSFFQSDNTEDKIKQLIRIKSSKDKPENAFSAVNYKDHWFWIDDRDFKSKRSFTFLMILFSMTESGNSDNLPLVTIPAG